MDVAVFQGQFDVVSVNVSQVQYVLMVEDIPGEFYVVLFEYDDHFLQIGKGIESYLFHGRRIPNEIMTDDNADYIFYSKEKAGDPFS